MNTIRKFIYCLLLVLPALPAASQTNGSNSPYSRYGFGLLSDGGNAFNKGMSGVAYGMRNGTELNTKNPASYSAIDSLSFLFDIGISMQTALFNQEGSKTNAQNSSVDYVTVGFRALPRLGLSLGLVPFSTIGYSTNTSETIATYPSEITQTTSYSGDGGLHEVYGGLGWAPAKWLSLGANVGYLWGDLEHTVKMSFSESSAYSNRQVYETDLRTYKVDFGLQYIQPFGKDNRVILGLTYGLGHDINTRADYYKQTLESSTVTWGDSISVSDAYQFPHSFGVGLTWEHKNSLRVGVDYTYQKWSNLNFPQVITTDTNDEIKYITETGNFTDLHKIAIGFEYVANPEGLRWRERIRYRAGFSYTTPYVKIDGLDGPRDYIASAGVAIPIINMYSNRTLLNVSFQYERVKPKTAGLITENYFRICLGLSFNERWFMKWKVE